VVGWECATANVHDTQFESLIKQFEAEMIVLADEGFDAKTGDPANLKICERGTWNVRMVVETVLSMLTLVSHFKRVMHRVWRYFEAARFPTSSTHPDRGGHEKRMVRALPLSTRSRSHCR